MASCSGVARVKCALACALLMGAVLVTCQEAKADDGGMTVSSLNIVGPENTDTKLSLGSGTNQYSIGVRVDGTFAIERDGLSFLSTDLVGNIFAKTEMLGAGTIDARNYFAVNGKRQWAMVASDIFDKGTHGWGNNCNKDCEGSRPCIETPLVTPCGGVTMLGGVHQFSVGEVSKTFQSLPPHTSLRITAVFHFIDRWEGEAGMMSVGQPMGTDAKDASKCPVSQVVWVQQYDSREADAAIDVCGDPSVGEGRFSESIDVTIPHKEDSVKIIFGSTARKGVTNLFWGISSVELYVL